MNDPILTMERPLAMRLLHEAQIAPGGVSGLVAAAAGRPDRFYPGPLPEALQRARGDGRSAWAVFEFRPDAPEVPAAEAFESAPAPTRLTACLATRGVLQLRAWQCHGGAVRECPLQIED